jgi:hypothetical protein
MHRQCTTYRNTLRYLKQRHHRSGSSTYRAGFEGRKEKGEAEEGGNNKNNSK